MDRPVALTLFFTTAPFVGHPGTFAAHGDALAALWGFDGEHNGRSIFRAELFDKRTGAVGHAPLFPPSLPPRCLLCGGPLGPRPDHQACVACDPPPGRG